MGFSWLREKEELRERRKGHPLDLRGGMNKKQTFQKKRAQTNTQNGVNGSLDAQYVSFPVRAC